MNGRAVMTIPQTEAVATAAQDRLRKLWRDARFTAPCPRITHGMVRLVIEEWERIRSIPDSAVPNPNGDDR